MGLNQGKAMAASDLVVALEGAGADEDALVNLMDEIGAVRGAHAARLEGGPAPEGSKALGLETMALLVQAGAGAIPKLVGSLGDWLTRQPQGTKLRIRNGDREFEWEGPMPPAEILALLKESGA